MEAAVIGGVVIEGETRATPHTLYVTILEVVSYYRSAAKLVRIDGHFAREEICERKRSRVVHVLCMKHCLSR